MICRYFILFIIYSCMGWIYESCYCTLKEHEWQNRGFLFGPVVPIYGAGALGCNILFVDIPINTLTQASNLTVFIVCAVGSFFLEYITSWTLEKLFHAKWWDYSDMPLNLNGRTCLPFTLCFGFAGILVLRVIIPWVTSLPITQHPLLTEIMALLFMLMFGMDIAFTVSALNNFNKNLAAINDQINAQIASAYASLESNVTDAREALIEKREQLAISTSVKKELKLEQREIASESKAELREAAIEALREKLSTQYLEEMLKKATPSQLGQFRHIKTVTHTDNNTKALWSRAAHILKNRIDKRKS